MWLKGEAATKASISRSSYDENQGIKSKDQLTKGATKTLLGAYSRNSPALRLIYG